MRPDPRACEEARALMSDYLDGELEDGPRRKLERHVRFCPRCHTVLANLRETVRGLRGMRDAERHDKDAEAVTARIVRRWRAEV
jgi:anti-sigma factor RsiW